MKIDLNKILNDPKIDQLDAITLRWVLDVLLAVKSNDVNNVIESVLAVIGYYEEIVTELNVALQKNVTCNVTSLQENVTQNVTQNVTPLQENVTCNVTPLQRNVTPLSGAERTRRCRERKNLKNSVTSGVTENVTCNVTALQNVTQEKEKSTKKEKELERDLINSQQNNLLNNNLNNNNSENLNQNGLNNNQNNSENDLKISENNLKDNSNTVNFNARNEKCNDDCNENVAGRNEKNKKNVTQKPKYTPDQPEFWQRAFGPNAEMAERFSKISGIIPVGNEFGLWQKFLKDYREAGITIEQMEAAVIKYRTDMPNATIKGPNSVFAIARDLANRRAVIPAAAEEEDILDVARRLQRERDMSMTMEALP